MRAVEKSPIGDSTLNTVRIAGLLLLIASWTAWSDTGTTNRVEVRTAQPAPAFALKNLAGQEVKSSQYAGKPLVVVFWTSLDKPCQRQLPALIELQQQFGGQGLTVLGISLDSVAPAELKAFATEQ